METFYDAIIVTFYEHISEVLSPLQNATIIKKNQKKISQTESATCTVLKYFYSPRSQLILNTQSAVTPRLVPTVGYCRWQITRLMHCS